MIKTFEDVEKFANLVSQKQGWALNHDKEFLTDLLYGLLKNWNRYGYFLCPCRDSEGSRNADLVVCCPCKIAKKDIEEFGNCFCGLYTSKKVFENKEEVKSIQDRGRVE